MQNQIEFANILCHFGKEKVMIDYLEEIIIPSFMDDSLVRQRGKENITNYYFYEVELKILDAKASPPIVGVVGQFVKDVNLIRTQIFDKDRGLIESFQVMPSAPSAYFLLIINNHHLVYLPKTPHAPSISEFSSTLKNFLKIKHTDYINELHKAAKENSEKITKSALWKLHPAPSVEILPLASSDTVGSFIKRFKLLKIIRFKLLKPNPTVDAGDTFKGMREILADLDAKSGEVVTRSAAGLDKVAATKIVGEAAQAGTNEITLAGDGLDGTELSGSNEDFNVRVPVEVMPPTQDRAAVRMFEAFVANISKLLTGRGDESESRKRKISELAGKL